MTLADYYRAEPPVRCPICAEPVFEWLGFAGAGAWLVWTEGRPEPLLDRVRPGQRGGREDATLAGLRLADGAHSIYGTCLGGHHLLAHIDVDGGTWNGLRIADAEGHEGVTVRGPFKLWWTVGRLVSIATERPDGPEQVVPATVSALGVNERCILATRRPPTREAQPVDDEWWIVDIDAARTYGPVPDPDLHARLGELGLEEPEHMTLPEDLGEHS